MASACKAFGIKAWGFGAQVLAIDFRVKSHEVFQSVWYALRHY